MHKNVTQAPTANKNVIKPQQQVNDRTLNDIIKQLSKKVRKIEQKVDTQEQKLALLDTQLNELEANTKPKNKIYKNNFYKQQNKKQHKNINDDLEKICTNPRTRTHITHAPMTSRHVIKPQSKDLLSKIKTIEQKVAIQEQELALLNLQQNELEAKITKRRQYEVSKNNVHKRKHNIQHATSNYSEQSEGIGTKIKNCVLCCVFCPCELSSMAGGPL